MGVEVRILVAALTAATAVASLGATVGAAQLPLPGTPAGPSSQRETGLLVRVAPGFTQSQLDALVSLTGAELERTVWEIRLLALSVPEENIALARLALDRLPGVEMVDEEAPVTSLNTIPNDAHWPGQWGLKRAGFPDAWDASRGSPKTIVAVIDTGVERTHPDLRDAVLPGYDFVDGDRDPSDTHGHGTAVAGVLAARTNNHTGIAGTCWSCSILPVRVLRRDGSGDTATLAAGIVWATDHGADVINLSLGGARNTIAEEDAVAYAIRNDVVVVAAAGNSGDRRRQYPAALKHVIAVAATDPADHLYAWSTRGDWIEIAAPGCNTSPWRGGQYATFCGTSSAAPLVAGAAALVQSAHPQAAATEVLRRVRASTSRLANGTAVLDASIALPTQRPVATDQKRPVATARKSRLQTLVTRLARIAVAR